jgi:hypothetical protein
MSGKAATRRAKARAQSESDRLDTTPERLARAAEAGQKTEGGADKLRRSIRSTSCARPAHWRRTIRGSTTCAG